MKAVSWNCKGMGSANKVEAIKDITGPERLDLLLIQEKKMNDVEVLALSQHLWKNSQGNAISSQGASGAIKTFFSRKYYIKDIKENQYWILTEFQEKYDPNVSYVCNVYGPTHSRDKKHYGTT